MGTRKSRTEAELEQLRQQREKNKKRRLRALRDLLVRTLLLLLVVYVLFFHLVGVTLMPNADMYPRIDAKDLVLYYRLDKDIHAQDIIVFEKPTAALNASTEGEEAEEAYNPSFIRKALNWLGFKDGSHPTTLFVCRVVAVPGETVEITDGERLLVNGNAMIESNIFYSTPQYLGFIEYPYTLGEGEYFVLADYRNGGADSRFFGAVKTDEILGTVITIVRRNNL